MSPVFRKNMYLAVLVMGAHQIQYRQHHQTHVWHSWSLVCVVHHYETQIEMTVIQHFDVKLTYNGKAFKVESEYTNGLSANF